MRRCAFLGSLDRLHVASVCTGALLPGAAGRFDYRAAATRRRSFAGVARPLTFDGAGRKGRLTRSAAAT
jgi:hypothetical protein